MKFYDKDLYEKENFIKTVLTIIIAFIVGLTTGYIILYSELQTIEQNVVNKVLDTNNFYESEKIKWVIKQET